jgi:hypothetical protein
VQHLNSKYILVIICVVTTLGAVNPITAQDMGTANETMENQTGVQMSAPETLSELESGLGNTQILENDTIVGQSPSGINWGDICRIPDVDSMITEPCETLTSSDGYTLTPEGNSVLYCILAGGIGKAIGMSDKELQQLSPVGGCGPQAQTASPTVQ